MLAAVLAYRTLRRSLTLTVVTCTVTMPTIATLYCRQIQVTSLGKLIQDIFWHPGFTHPKRKRPIYLGKYRLGMQVFICGYVLIFATLVSVLLANLRSLEWSYSTGAGSGFRTYLFMYGRRSPLHR
jgi:hypothetical protein